MAQFPVNGQKVALHPSEDGAAAGSGWRLHRPISTCFSSDDASKSFGRSPEQDGRSHLRITIQTLKELTFYHRISNIQAQ